MLPNQIKCVPLYIEVHCESSAGDGYFAIAYSRPDELAFFQTFGKQAQTVSISPEDLHCITLAATEDKQVAMSSRTCWTSSPSPLKDLRISVTPATSQIRVPDDKGIIGSSRLARGAVFSGAQVISPRIDAGWPRRQLPRMSWPRGRQERRVHSAVQHGVTGPYQARQRG